MLQTAHNDKHHRTILPSIAHRAMLERGLLQDFSTAALAELGRIQAPVMKKGASAGKPALGASAGTQHPMRDMRDLYMTKSDEP